MSYTIVYDRVFIKTSTGYTLAVLHGDNNVWETDRKRARDWNCWILNSSVTDIQSHFKGWLGREFQEHFQTNGKWINDDKLMRWVNSGLKNARTIEEIYAIKPFERLRCCLRVYDTNIAYSEKKTL